LKADRDFGFKSLFNIPGENAKGFSLTSKSFSLPLSGCKASSGDSYSRLDFEWTVTVEVAEMPEFDRRRVVGSLDWSDPDLELRVDPSKGCFRSGVVGDRYEPSSMAVDGGVDILCPLLCVGDIGDIDDSGCSVRLEVSSVILGAMGLGDERPAMMGYAQ